MSRRSCYQGEIGKLYCIVSRRSLNQLGININIHKSDGSEDFFSSLYEIHQKAASFYVQNLNSDVGTHAKQYLLNRGINEAFLKKFKIGFALPDQLLINKITPASPPSPQA